MTLETFIGQLSPINILKSVWKYFTKPKLEIYYDPRETYHKAYDYSFNGTLGVFCHVMVKNKGREVAKNCIGELRSIKQLVNGIYENIPEYRNIMQLKWAHEMDYSPKDIDEIPIRLDLCYVHQEHDILHFFTKKYPGGNQTSFSPGEYLVEVRVKSENASSVDNKFTVKYVAGSLDNLKIDNYTG